VTDLVPASAPAPQFEAEAVAPKRGDVAVASQAQLVWWAFRRHHLAMVGLVVTVIFYLIAAAPGFFSINDPTGQNARTPYHPPEQVSIFADGGGLTWPYFIPEKLARDPETLAAVYVPDKQTHVPLVLFGHGFTYKLFGIFQTDVHLLVSSDPSHVFFPLGADRLGRCVWSRIMEGAQVSLSIGLVGVALSLLIGIILGGISGYYGGRIDFVIQRVIEFVLALPTIPIWMAMAAALPQNWPATWQYFMITLIISLTSWAHLARVVRGRFLSLRTDEFVAAARLDGCSEGRIIFRHMLPSFMSHIIASITLAIPAMILAETALSFLGLGLQPPTISWGVLLQEAQNVRSIATAPWLFAPGIAVVLAVMALNLLGDGLRDAADPYNK
jgi:peptide/nickel transport system permease protein